MMTENIAKARHSLRDKVGLCPLVHPSQQELQPLFVLCNFFHLNREQDNCPPRVAPQRDESTYPGFLLHGLHRFLH